MIIFLTWLSVALLGIFLVLPYLRIRTSLLKQYNKNDIYFFGVLYSFAWPISLPVLFLLYPCMYVCVEAVSMIEGIMQRKSLPVPVKPEPPAVNAAKSDYRHVKYDDGYSHHREY